MTDRQALTDALAEALFKAEWGDYYVPKDPDYLTEQPVEWFYTPMELATAILDALDPDVLADFEAGRALHELAQHIGSTIRDAIREAVKE